MTGSHPAAGPEPAGTGPRSASGITVQRLLVGIVTLFGVVLLLGGGALYNWAVQVRHFDADADQVVDAAARAIESVERSMETLVSQHQARAGRSGSSDAFDEVAEAWLPNAPDWVASVGRWASINGFEREMFEARNADSGLYEYRLAGIDYNGQRTELPRAERYVPIARLAPLGPARLRLLGSDLSRLDGYTDTIDQAIATGRLTSARFPAHWPGAGELFVTRATYLGTHAPPSARERVRQNDGGYWMLVDPVGLVDAIGTPLARFGFAMDLEGETGRTTLLESVATDPEATLLAGLYPRRTIERRFALGESALMLTLYSDIAMATPVLIVLIGVTALVVVLALLSVLHVNHRRHAGALSHQARHDPLTGCPNRRYFESRLDELLGEPPGRRHALLAIDLDKFKIVNDTLGHEAGDDLLKELTASLTGLARGSDMLGRLGGDEFGLILVDVEPEHALGVTEKVSRFFSGYVFERDGRRFPVSGSIGLATFEGGSGERTELLAEADAASYAAKRAGRDGVFVVDRVAGEPVRHVVPGAGGGEAPPAGHAGCRDRVEVLARRVRSCPGPGEDAPEERFEILIARKDDLARAARRGNPDAGPDRLRVSDPEDYRWGVAHALECIGNAGSGAARYASFEVALGRALAIDPELPEWLDERCVRAGIMPERLWVSLACADNLLDVPHLGDSVAALRERGVRVAVDALGAIGPLGADALRIGSPFIDGLDAPGRPRVLLQALVRMARRAGALPVLVGVDSCERRAALAGLGRVDASGTAIDVYRSFDEAVEPAPDADAPPAPLRRAS